MKDLTLIILFILNVNLYATDKVKCEDLFSSATYSFYLENTCKFDGHNSVSYRKEFGDKGCPGIFDDSDIKRVTNKILGETYQKMNKIGRDKFCYDNKIIYNKTKKDFTRK